MNSKLEILKRIHNLLSVLGKPKIVMDLASIELLLVISDAEISGKPLKVSDVRFDYRFGSPATALKRLQKLTEINWVITAEDPRDSRVQRLSLSDIARKELMTVAEKIVRAVAAS